MVMALQDLTPPDELMQRLGDRLNALTPWDVRVRGWVGPYRGRTPDGIIPRNTTMAWIRVLRLWPPSRSVSARGLGAAHPDEVVSDALESFQQTLWNYDHRAWPRRTDEPGMECEIDGVTARTSGDPRR